MIFPYTINYWITPSGELIKVSSHRSYAEHILGYKLKYGYSDYSDLYKKGYVKVIYEPEPKIYVHYLHSQTLSAKQLKTIRELSIERGCKGSFDRIPEIGYRDQLTENFQLAKKLYIDTNLLTPDEQLFLTQLCNNDYTYKTLADLLISDRQYPVRMNREAWKNAHTQLLNYNPNVFPIKDFDFSSHKAVISRSVIQDREKILQIIADWPSIARRNLRNDIRVPRDIRTFHTLLDTITYADRYMSYLNNRTSEMKDKILKKIFSSQHLTFDDIVDFVEEKQNLLNNHVFTKDELKKIVSENTYDLKIVYDVGNIVVVDVTGVDGIKAIGCNSLWCFTYGSEYGLAGEQWDRYSYNGHVYAIINFGIDQSAPEFIHLLTKNLDMNAEEDDTGIYDMSNDAQYGNQYELLKYLVKTNNIESIFKFEDF